MLHNYLKIAVRNLLKFKSFAFINLFGLALGLTAGILIMVYVLDEISFDKFHEKASRVYRVNTQFLTSESGGGGYNSTNGWPVGKILEKDFPEVEAVLYARSGFLMVNHGDRLVREKSFFVSPEFFQLFSFPLVKGNPERALNEPYAVVISEDMEKKYFPDGDALNKTLVMADTLNVLVTGVMKNIPSNSHIQGDMFLSFATFTSLESSFSFEEGWGNINMTNYVLLKEGADFNDFAAKTRYFMRAVVF